ncbi:MAG TPA: hypothetical protein VGK60_00975 [Pedococcus sp.]
MKVDSQRRARTTSVAAAAAAGWVGLEYALALAALQQWRLVTVPGPASIGVALTLVAALVAVLVCTWLGLSTLAALLTHLPGRIGRLADRVAQAWAPPVTQRLAAVLVGAAVTGALAPGTALGEAPPPAAAAVPAAPAPGRAGAGLAGSPRMEAPGFAPTETTLPSPGFAPTAGSSGEGAPGWVPTRPVQRHQPSAALVVPGQVRHEAAEVVVHRGDTLWGIVARHLGTHASDAEVAQAWPRWYAANRQVIGDDPDLVKPGQVLHAPETQHAAVTR